MSKIYKPQPISGFPEWLPDTRALELKWLDHIRKVFESYGFANIETPAIEVLDVLAAKGEVENEIYGLQRLKADDKDKSDARLALRFDNTVPFARYAAQHFNELSFPFKRYQIQKVWRGERPQEGRFREFYQCDIDVINPENLPLHFDAEVVLIIEEILKGLNIPPYTIKINNRKILDGYLQGIGMGEERFMAFRILDKLDKISADGVFKELTETLKVSPAIANRALEIMTIKGRDKSVIDQVRALNVTHPMLDEGIDELSYVIDSLGDFANSSILIDLSIVRGLDYYTGTVYETKLNDFPNYPSIVGGGRYADLAGSYINKRLPGVGISIGVTRLFSKLLNEKLLTQTPRPSPTDILITQADEMQRGAALKLAQQLRQRGFNVEVYHAATKMDKQLIYANKKQIPYVWFLPNAESTDHQVKNMLTKQQDKVDPVTWKPDETA
jgi:histidyl-tRNA synthetase